MIKVLDKKSACVFWGIDEAELRLVVARGFLKKTDFGDIVWETRHIAWKKLLDDQTKRICDLESPKHRYGMKRLAVVNKWGIYQYKPSVIKAGKGDSLTYVYAMSAYLEKAFDTYQEADTFCRMNVPLPAPLVTSIHTRSYKKSPRINARVKQLALHDWQKQQLALDETAEADVDPDAVIKNPKFGRISRNFNITLAEAEEVMMVLGAHREEMGERALNVATRLLSMLTQAGFGGDFIKQIYSMTALDAKRVGRNRGSDDDSAGSIPDGSSFRHQAVEAMVESRRKKRAAADVKDTKKV